MKDEKADVFKVYDKIADWFSLNRYTGLLEIKYLEMLTAQLKPGDNILDLGCGTGIPIYQYLILQGYNVTGVDASHKMIEIAQANFPDGNFLCQDMRHLSVGGEYQAIIAWHSFFHLPADDQRKMFPIFAANLRQNGLLIFTSGPQAGEVWGMNGGENLFHASLDPAEYRSLLESNGFTVQLHQVNDPDCGADVVWVAIKR